MKKILLPAFMLASIFARSQSIDYSNHHLSFHENFDYACPSYPSNDIKLHTSAPLSTSGTTIGHPFRDFWDTDNGLWGEDGGQYFDEMFVQMAAPGIIRLRESAVIPYNNANGKTIYYHAGYIRLAVRSILDGYNANYGYGIIESRIRLPEYIGNDATADCSFWLNGWADTEIDIVDISDRGYSTTRVIDKHYPPHGNALSHNWHPMLFDTNFHTYSVVWSPSIVKFYLDGVFINEIGYETVRTFPFFYALEFAIQPVHQNNQPSWQYMEVDWVKIWKPNCEEESLSIPASPFHSFYQDHPDNGRLFKYEHVNISDPNVYSAPFGLPTIIEAKSIEVESAFEADQSYLGTSTLTLDGGTKTQTSNGFFEIIAIDCATDNEPWYVTEPSNENLPTQQKKGSTPEKQKFLTYLDEADTLKKAVINEPSKNVSTYGGVNVGSATMSDRIRIFPTVTNGDVNIVLGTKAVCEIKVINSTGSTIYNSSLHGENKHVIHLDDNLPAGNYVLQITGKELRHVEKITLVR